MLGIQKLIKNIASAKTIEKSKAALAESSQIELHLNQIYETYVEMREKGLAEQLIAITLYPSPGSMDSTKLGVGISIQFDGVWFWKYIENDFIPSLYEVGIYEDFREWKSLGVNTGSWESIRNKIDFFLQDYKASNAEKGEYLNFLHVQPSRY